MMKRNLIYIMTFALFAVFTFSACEDDDNLRFTATGGDSLMFTNSFLAEYLISEDFEDNVAERLVWNEPDFGAPVNVTYELQGSLNANMSDMEILGSTAALNQAVLVSQLLGFADDLGLDDDPATTDEDGNVNNAGTVYVRVRAFTGTGAANSEESISEITPMNIVVLEKVADGACPSLWAVGAGLPASGWEWSNPAEFTCENDVLTGRVELTNDAFRFFENEGDWDSGLNYPYFIAEGYTIDANFEDAMDGDNNFSFIGTPGMYDLVIDQNAKTITLEEAGPVYLVGDGTEAGWGWDTPVVLEQSAPYVYSGSVTLNTAGAFRVFTVRDDWGSGLNFPYYDGEGYEIDPAFINAEDGDSNFKFDGTPGTYTMTIDEINETITLE